MSSHSLAQHVHRPDVVQGFDLACQRQGADQAIGPGVIATLMATWDIARARRVSAAETR